ncbi:hypothetical protein J40TS1_21590 [Paenibacillus montaniterrae]|uniref:Uncharacterized protein n=1 Tax=Paenibacillus montaniterrae TaxID=429341 RepID=A0A919YLB7_9BACL|nr:hypothetical protein [Paenibacillus montaniterrae]GIP16517.1 hypothetical protein J40TS1_21590 [Paenibacillus montaniterrae]
MSKTRTIVVSIASAMLAYSLMLPMASGAMSDLDVKGSSKQQDETKLDKQAHPHAHKKMTSEEIKQMRIKKLKRLAQYFDISTDGKSLEQLKAEVDQAKKAQPEKWEAFKQEFRAKKLEKIREYAKSKGIDIKDKSLEQLHDELHELEERSNHQ